MTVNLLAEQPPFITQDGRASRYAAWRIAAIQAAGACASSHVFQAQSREEILTGTSIALRFGDNRPKKHDL